MMTASVEHEDAETMGAESPRHDLPPDSIQETISKQWLDKLNDTKQMPVSMETRLETGRFLQQLTNSVNRALHKQNCTCNGKVYTADELRAISNPAMFAPVATPTGKPDQGIVTLPPIEDAAKKIAPDLVAANNSPLKVYLERDCGKKFKTFTVKRGALGAKPLGGVLATEKEKEELKLPNIMDITDVSGNNWKIIQDVSRQRQPRTARYDTKLFDGQSATMQECRSPPKTPSGNSRAGAAREIPVGLAFEGKADDAAINAVIRSNSPQDVAAFSSEGSCVDVGQHEAACFTSPRNDEQTKDSTTYLPELAPKCTLVQINQTPRLNVDSFQTSYDEAERRSLLSQLNSAVRTGKIPYSEFLKRVSSLAPSFRVEKGRDKRVRTSSMEQAIPDRSKRQDTKHPSDQSVTLTQEPNTINHEVGTMANTFASSSYTGIYAKDPNAMFPPELQNLYARSGLKVTTLNIDVGDSLPENFLTRDKEELRVLYPMYDSRVEQERENLIARMNSLQSKVEKDQKISPRQNRAGIPSDARMLLFPSSDVPSSADPDDFKLKFKVRKGPDGRNREGRMYYLQGRQSISREGEVLDLPAESSVRRVHGSDRESFCPSRNFPKQPPTTPADDRRQSQDGGSELVARSVANMVTENQDAEKKEESGENNKLQENSSSKSLGVIPEDPLDVVSHANTYGTELYPKRMVETFGESLDKDETKMLKEYLHVVVPTSKGKRVSWLQPEKDGDDTTEFTKSRETLQSIQTNEKPATPDRLQMPLTISDVSEGNSGRGDELKPILKVLEIDNSSIGTYESLVRKPLYTSFAEPEGHHGTQTDGNSHLGDGRRDGPVTISTQKVVFISPLQGLREK